jgi:Leucine-rich repeat (LRR) protein
MPLLTTLILSHQEQGSLTQVSHGISFSNSLEILDLSKNNISQLPISIFHNKRAIINLSGMIIFTSKTVNAHL